MTAAKNIENMDEEMSNQYEVDEEKDVLVTSSNQVFDFSENKTVQPVEEEKKLDETLKKKDEKFKVIPKKEKSGLVKKKGAGKSKKHDTIDAKQNPSFKTTNSDLQSASTPNVK